MDLKISFTPPSVFYDIEIKEGVSESFFQFCSSLNTRFFIISSSIFANYAINLQKKLPQSTDIFHLPDGEKIKTHLFKQLIEDELIRRGYGRDSCLILVGGGSLLDLGGFVAATYCRGIPYISFPYTLLSMTDASIGGKTAINVTEAKNWIGAFHHPVKIYCDLDLLETLPQMEYVSGLSESVKHALIKDRDFFTFLEKQMDTILRREKGALKTLIFESCRIKKEIVEEDPFEKKGIRSLLNFGHTLGHALEKHLSIRHGEAVAFGMRIEGWMSCERGDLSQDAFQRMEALLGRFPFSLRKTFSSSSLFNYVRRDKKNRSGSLRVVSLLDIGLAHLVEMSEKSFEEAVSYALRCD